MNPTSIYSKTGKGVQEASGKTSQLSRGDRAILSAIDGKTNLKELSAKFDRAPDDTARQGEAEDHEPRRQHRGPLVTGHGSRECTRPRRRH